MKLIKLSLAAAAAALVVSTASVASANNVADGTYVFTDTTGNYGFLTGSTVTFAGDVLQSWNITDTLDNDIFNNLNSYIPTGIDPGSINPGNPTGNDFYQPGVYGPDDWSYVIVANSPDANFDPRVSIGNNGIGDIYLQPSYTVSLDPDGTWTPVGTGGQNGGVPDASATFQLLAGTLTALGACGSFLRRRA